VVQTPARGGGNGRFGVKGDAETGSLQHRQIIGAIADRERLIRSDAEFPRQRQQSLPLGLAGYDRLEDAAGQTVLGDLQPVGDKPVETELSRDGLGKECEPAGYEGGCRTGPPHRRDQAAGAAGVADPRSGFGENFGLGPGQQRNPGGECLGEVDFAVHRPPGDLGDLRPEPEDCPQFVEHLVFDDCRFEVGDEQPLAPAGNRLQQIVDRCLADDRPHRPLDRRRIVGFEENVAGLHNRKPDGGGRDFERFADRGGNARQTGIGTGGDQGEDRPHRVPSYLQTHSSDKTRAAAASAIIIAGPTASGKSALAAALAEEIGGTVINGDALQCYRDLEILTARPDAKAQARAPHRLYGYLDAAERGSAADWRERALGEIAATVELGRLPIVVGGTGLYLRALQHGLAPFPEIPAAICNEAAALHRALGGAAFRERLGALDPASARRLPAGDTQRLVRAYAVVRATGVPIGRWRDRPHRAAPYRFATILIMPPREALYAACNARFAAMLESGALAEAEALAARELDPGLPAMKAVGLPELLRHLRGEMTLAEATAAAQRATRRYAKRQTTWFRHQTHPDLILGEQYSESLLRRSRQFIDEFVLTARG
jgi:tRNA dimethylallyltransferase